MINRMALTLTKARTAFALGLPNILRAAGYRLGVRLGLSPVRCLAAPVPQGPFFTESQLSALVDAGVSDWQSVAHLFSRWPVPVGVEPPDWLANPLTGQAIPQPDRPWWQIPDFDPAVGDIKLIWELSRMDWLLALAQRVRQGDAGALDRLNHWLQDWVVKNPPYRGPNWKCGQEASFRVIHLAAAALMLGQDQQALPGLRDLLALHLQRIAPTVQYAMAQDNNHGTSEAVALFVGGAWLDRMGDPRGVRWAAKGRWLMENRAARLVGPDGTFSQYSVNYHRVMLDTYSFAELWRKQIDLPVFSSVLLERLRAATHWLFFMTDPGSGDAPNIGANDGARLLQLAQTTYRDYRPTVQLAMAVFCGSRAYAIDGAWNESLRWLGLELPEPVAAPPQSYQADDGGFAVLRRGPQLAVLRFPRFRFRPSQADVLHLDFWVNGHPHLRDAGTYSYNTDPKWIAYFGGIAGHNSVQFDSLEPMPRLSRFLLGDWLKTSELSPVEVGPQSVQCAAAYQGPKNTNHHRHVLLTDAELCVTDRVTGFDRSAVLRWRLSPGDWKLSQQVTASGQIVHACSLGQLIITVSSDVPVVRSEITERWESLHYLEKTPVPVFELEIAQAGTLVTKYHWMA